MAGLRYLNPIIYIIYKNKLKRSASIDLAERFNHISKVLGLMVESLKLSLEISTFRVKLQV